MNKTIIKFIFILIFFSVSVQSLPLLGTDNELKRALNIGYSVIKVKILDSVRKKNNNTKLYANLYKTKLLKTIFGDYAENIDFLYAGYSYGSALKKGEEYILIASKGVWAFRGNVVHIDKNFDRSQEEILSQRLFNLFYKTEAALKKTINKYLKYIEEDDADNLETIYKENVNKEKLKVTISELKETKLLCAWLEGKYGFALLVKNANSNLFTPFFLYFILENKKWKLVYDSVIFKFPDTENNYGIKKVSWKYLPPLSKDDIKNKTWAYDPILFLRYLTTQKNEFRCFFYTLTFDWNEKTMLKLKPYLDSHQPCAALNSPDSSIIKRRTTIGNVIKELKYYCKKSKSK